MLNGVWMVMDNIEPTEAKVFISKEKALKYFEKSKAETLMGNIGDVDIIEEYCKNVGTDDELRYVEFSETIQHDNFEENVTMWLDFTPFSDEEI